MFELHLTTEELWIIEIALSGELVTLSKQLAKEDFEAFKKAWEEYEKVSALSKRTGAMLDSSWKEVA